jgi:hypothetical protein
MKIIKIVRKEDTDNGILMEITFKKWYSKPFVKDCICSRFSRISYGFTYYADTNNIIFGFSNTIEFFLSTNKNEMTFK